VADELDTFAELRPEFVLLLARMANADPEGMSQCTSFGLAMQFVLQVRVGQMVYSEQFK
jgi:hypothetical protein